jgi:hypothetical protein
MIVAFELTVPVVHPLSGITWHTATVVCSHLDLTTLQAFEIVRNILDMDSRGSVNTILQLAYILREMTDEVPVNIVWESTGWGDLPISPDLRIKVDYNSGEVYTPELTFDFETIQFNFTEVNVWARHNDGEDMASCKGCGAPGMCYC